MHGGTEDIHVTVGVSADENGNITGFVQKIARGEAAKAGAMAVHQANRTAPAAVAKRSR